MLIECCGGSFRDLRAEAGSWQSVVNEAALRIVKDSVDVNYVQEIVEMVEQSKQNLHQPWSDELSELSQDRDVYVRFQDSTPDEREQCLSPRDKSIRDISLRIYHHRRANRRVRSAHSIPKPVVPREDNQSWRYWIGEIPAESQGDARRVEVAKHLHQIRVAVSEAYKESDSRTELSWPDAEGQTLLHAFISLIDPRTMGSHDVQETLRVILSCSGDSLHKRNKHGETPLHLAVRFALPHVVTTLLRHFVSGLVNDEGRADLLRKAIDVSDNSGTSLFTDLHLTYWLARHSDEPEALHFEIDALICVRIIVNAMVGDTPAEDHTFREFRNVKVFTERRSYASKRLRWQPGRTPFIPSNNARRYRPIEPVGAHLQRQNYVGISQKAPQSPNDMSFREDNPPSYHGANNTMAPASDTVGERWHYYKHPIFLTTYL
jgi:hypothetical protein